MHNDSGIPLKELGVDGGVASNNLLLQFQADILRARWKEAANRSEGWAG